MYDIIPRRHDTIGTVVTSYRYRCICTYILVDDRPGFLIFSHQTSDVITVANQKTDHRKRITIRLRSIA